MSSGSRLYKRDPKSRRVSQAKPAPRVRPERSRGFHVEIVCVGREILRGQIVDRNGGFLAAEFSRRGALIHRITVVDDHDRSIASVITEGLKRGASLIVTTGGLGPTSDDRTLGAVADALGVPLAIHPEAKALVERAFRELQERGRIGRSGMTRAREKMCAIPVGAVPIPNPVGIAPGVIARLPGGTQVLCLPGIPEEMQTTWKEAVSRIRDLGKERVIARREVEAPNADESVLEPWLEELHREFPGVWIKTHAPGFGAKAGGTRLTFEASAPSRHEAELAVDGAVRRLLALAGAG